MTHTPEDHEAGTGQVEQLFRDVAARFPHAMVRTDAPGGPRGNGLMDLSCSLPGTTPVRALAGADQVDLYLGEDTWLELLASRRKPERLLERVREVVDSVVTGRFEERVCERRGRIVASRRRFHGRHRPAMDWYVPIMLPGHRRKIRYAPYG